MRLGVVHLVRDAGALDVQLGDWGLAEEEVDDGGSDGQRDEDVLSYGYVCEGGEQFAEQMVAQRDGYAE